GDLQARLGRRRRNEVDDRLDEAAGRWVVLVRGEWRCAGLPLQPPDRQRHRRVGLYEPHAARLGALGVYSQRVSPATGPRERQTHRIARHDPVGTTRKGQYGNGLFGNEPFPHPSTYRCTQYLLNRAIREPVRG